MSYWLVASNFLLVNMFTSIGELKVGGVERRGISTLVVTVVLMVVGVAGALLAYGVLRGQIRLAGRKMAGVASAAQVEVIGLDSSGNIIVKNTGTTVIPDGNWEVVVDGQVVNQVTNAGELDPGETLALSPGTFTFQEGMTYVIEVSGPAGATAQYVYSP